MPFIDDKLIYIVDDSEIIADMLRKLIDRMDGYAAVDFHSGEEMLLHLSVRKPELILLDYYLDDGKKPKMSGSQILQTVKVLYPDLPVVLITGMSDARKFEALRSEGYDEVIHKDSPEILRDITNIVQRHTR